VSRWQFGVTTVYGFIFVPLTELLTPGALFPADRTVVVATHHLPDDVVCPALNLSACG
jgi:hypothetical protein